MSSASSSDSPGWITVPKNPPAALRRLDRLLHHTRVRAVRQDLINRARYGGSAPRAHELQYVRLAEVKTALIKGVAPARSGTVAGGDWDLAVKPITEVTHIRQCLQRWGEGQTWEQTGAIEHVLALIAAGGGTHSGMRSRADVERRYAAVDRLYEAVRSEGELGTRRQVAGRGFREYGGVLVHFDREARPVYNGWQGCHRLAAAIQCQLEWIPVQVGMVHEDAVRTWRSGTHR